MSVVSVRAFVEAKWRFRHLRGVDLARFQHERAVSTIKFARQNSPYYRELFVGLDAEDWRTFPTTDKAAMMARFGDFNTRGVSLETAMGVALRAERDRNFSLTVDGLTVGLSSGTSGHRGLFLLSAQEQAAWAGTVLARALPGIRKEGWKIAFFLRSNSNLYEEVAGRFIQFRFFDLMTPMPEAVAALNVFQPDILVAPPSMLGLLANEGALRVCPRKVISVAEPLEAQDAARFESAFDCPVGQIYQCTEGFLAVTCSAGSSHVQEDVVALDFEMCGEGRVTPIVTDLWRRVQPIVRYRLNDVLMLSSRRCACGSDFRIIERVEGRRDDVCEFESLDGTLRSIFPDAIRRAILLASPRIRDYRAVQEQGTFRVHVEVEGEADVEVVAREVQREFKEMAARYGLRPFRVEVEQGLPPTLRDRKRRRVQRLT